MVEYQPENAPLAPPRSLTAERLRLANCAEYHVPGLTAREASFTFDRAFISKLYGGNTQSMFPKISRTKVRDGIDNLAFLNPQYNPFAPRNVGHSGLFFVLNPEWRGEMTKRLFVRLDQSSWRHVGTYKFIPSRPLSVTEFRTLSSAVCIISDDKLDN